MILASPPGTAGVRALLHNTLYPTGTPKLIQRICKFIIKAKIGYDDMLVFNIVGESYSIQREHTRSFVDPNRIGTVALGRDKAIDAFAV